MYLSGKSKFLSFLTIIGISYVLSVILLFQLVEEAYVLGVLKVALAVTPVLGFFVYCIFDKWIAGLYQKSENLKESMRSEKQRTESEEKAHQIAVRREREVLQARADVQISTMERLHAQNVSVERQLMELRKELQAIENDENKAFMEEMIRQAERSLKG
ncbi:MAG: hypothetical protein E6Q89_05915 [Bacteroidia bacterium]|nr:MAG: hypothetical protein E6Q89_05915 [Bacteroidia bacterium]